MSCLHWTMRIHCSRAFGPIGGDRERSSRWTSAALFRRSTGSRRKRLVREWCISRALARSAVVGAILRLGVPRAREAMAAAGLLRQSHMWRNGAFSTAPLYSRCIGRSGSGGREGARIHSDRRRQPRRAAGTPGYPVTSSVTASVHHRNPSPRGREAARAGPAPGGSDAGGNDTPSARSDTSPRVGKSEEKSGGAGEAARRSATRTPRVIRSRLTPYGATIWMGSARQSG